MKLVLIALLAAGLAITGWRAALSVQGGEATVSSLVLETRGAAINDVEYAALRDVGVRVPHYSPEQTASMLCRATKSGGDEGRAMRVHDATMAFEQVKRDARAGRATLADLKAAELTRQEALWLPPGQAYQYGADVVPPLRPTFELRDVQYSFTRQRGEEVAVMSGAVFNASRSDAVLPGLNVYAVDRFGMVLTSQSFRLAGPDEALRLRPRAETRFEIVFANRPQYAVKLIAVVGQAIPQRDPRDCDIVTPFRPQFGPLYAEATLGEQAALEAIRPGQFEVDDVRARIVRERGVRVLEVSASLRNLARQSQVPPGLTVVLYDEANRKIAFTTTRLENKVLRGGGREAFTQRFETFTRLPGVPDDDLLTRMKRVAILPG